jgi:hypothetical protein
MNNVLSNPDFLKLAQFAHPVPKPALANSATTMSTSAPVVKGSNKAWGYLIFGFVVVTGIVFLKYNFTFNNSEKES